MIPAEATTWKIIATENKPPDIRVVPRRARTLIRPIFTYQKGDGKIQCNNYEGISRIIKIRGDHKIDNDDKTRGTKLGILGNG